MIVGLISTFFTILPLERTAAAAAATAAASASTAPLIDSSLLPSAPVAVDTLLLWDSTASPGSWADVGKLLETHAWRMFLLPSHLSSKAASKRLPMLTVNTIHNKGTSKL